MELHPHRVHFRSLILTFFLGVCVIVIGVVYRYQESGYFVPSSPTNTSTIKTQSIDNQKPNTKVKLDQTQDVVVKNSAQIPNSAGRFVIQADPEGKKDELFKIMLFGTSDGKRPVGYDALVSIAGGSYDIVSVKSLTSEFSIMKFVKSGRVTVTGVLMPRIKEAKVWNGEAIAEITIKPKTEGRYNLSVLESSGRETSKIIVKDDDGQSIRLTSTASQSVLVDITN